MLFTQIIFFTDVENSRVEVMLNCDEFSLGRGRGKQEFQSGKTIYCMRKDGCQSLS